MSWTGPTLGGALEALTLVGTRIVLSLWGAREAQQASLGGALEALTLVGARVALTLVGALESWTEPAAMKMNWAGPAEELESTCEESALERSRHERALARSRHWMALARSRHRGALVRSRHRRALARSRLWGWAPNHPLIVHKQAQGYLGALEKRGTGRNQRRRRRAGRDQRR